LRVEGVEDPDMAFRAPSAGIAQSFLVVLWFCVLWFLVNGTDIEIIEIEVHTFRGIIGGSTNCSESRYRCGKAAHNTQLLTTLWGVSMERDLLGGSESPLKLPRGSCYMALHLLP
jgi:hypothetical protein